MDDKTYTVMELAEAVGVARTTINDWLSKYSPYIDFKTVGRRRVYTAAAVEVLKEISELRNQGLASGDIETELSKKHPMRAEPADLQEKQEAPKGNVPAAPRSSGTEGTNHEDFALIAQRQSDEIGRLFAESFQNMASRIETLENKAGNAERKLYIGYGIVFVLLLLLCVLSFFLFFGIFLPDPLADALLYRAPARRPRRWASAASTRMMSSPNRRTDSQGNTLSSSLPKSPKSRSRPGTTRALTCPVSRSTSTSPTYPNRQPSLMLMISLSRSSVTRLSILASSLHHD